MFRVYGITGRNLADLARKLEKAMNKAVEEGAQVTKVEKHGRGYLVFTYQQPAVPSVLMAIARAAAQEQVAQKEEEDDGHTPSQHSFAFLMRLSDMIHAHSKTEFERELPNAVLRAMRTLGPGEAQEIKKGLQDFVTKHRAGGCVSCPNSDVSEKVIAILEKQLSATLC